MAVIWLPSKAQTSPSGNAPVDSAMLYLTGSFKKYNPRKAFSLFMARAQSGEAKAMNAVGLQYAKGLGVDSNFNLAVYWLSQAATNGYTKAWVNLGMLYKHIATDSAGFAAAGAYFITAVEHHEPSAYFASGYMYYKGLGCSQSYQTALTLFRTGIQYDRPDCMYFTGLCFKYGYGVAANADSASYYINKAALKGYNQANAELARNTTGSNTALRGINGKSPTLVRTAELKEAKTAFRKVPETREFFLLDGAYSGVITQYDYSGKKIISQVPLGLAIKTAGNKITGVWQLDKDEPIDIEAIQDGNKLAFSPSNFLTSTIKAKNRKQRLVFKRAWFTSVQTSDSFYLNGNLELYNTYTREIEKPVTIRLARAGKGGEVIEHQAISVYPNPISHSFTVSFTVAKSGPVKIGIYNAQGQLVYTKIAEITNKGNQVITIDADLKTTGIYILKLSGNTINESIGFLKE